MANSKNKLSSDLSFYYNNVAYKLEESGELKMKLDNGSVLTVNRHGLNPSSENLEVVWFGLQTHDKQDTVKLRVEMPYTKNMPNLKFMSLMKFGLSNQMPDIINNSIEMGKTIDRVNGDWKNFQNDWDKLKSDEERVRSCKSFANKITALGKANSEYANMLRESLLKGAIFGVAKYVYDSRQDIIDERSKKSIELEKMNFLDKYGERGKKYKEYIEKCESRKLRTEKVLVKLKERFNDTHWNKFEPEVSGNFKKLKTSQILNAVNNARMESSKRISQKYRDNGVEMNVPNKNLGKNQER